MTYRIGVYVVDTRSGRLGQLMGMEGPYAQLRPPRGGREWDCPPKALRLAMREEREAAGLHSTPLTETGPQEAETPHPPAHNALLRKSAQPCPFPCQICRDKGRQ